MKNHNFDILIDDTDENLSSKIKKFNLRIPNQIIIGKTSMIKKLNLKKLIKNQFLFLDEIINKINNQKKID